MSYNNPSGEATYTYTNSGVLILDPATSGLIASSAAAGSQYYAQNLTIPTGGAVVSGATIDDKGKLYTNQTVYNITVLSGGTLQRGGGGIGANNITVMSGGTMLGWNGGQAYWSGTWNIQSGANIFGYTDVYTDADGYLNYGWHGLTGALNPYIKIRNIDVNSYLYVRGGGVSGAIVRGGATAASNAYLHFYSAGMSAYDVHILSGGSFHIYAGNVKIWNIKGDEGARMTFQANNSFGGRETTFAKGFFTNVGLTEAYANQGTIYNWAKPSTGAAFYFYDLTLDTGDATNQFIYLGTGAETRNFTIGGASGANTGIVLGQAGQGSAIDTTATGAGGGITVNSSYFATFGGTSNNLAAGHILLGGAGAGVANTSLSIIGDKFYGIEVKNYSNNSTYLKYVKLVEGLTAIDPIVSSGGSLVLGSGGSATGAVIHAGGTLQALKGGTVSGATLSNGNLYIMDYNYASETASVGRPAAFANNVDIEGGQMFLRGSNASGANLRLSNGILYMQNAAHASGVTVTGGALSAYYNNVNPMDATTIYLNDLTMAGGSADLNTYALASGVTVNGGEVTVSNGGSATDVAANTGGTFKVLGGGWASGATIAGGTVNVSEGGILSGAVLNAGTMNFYKTGFISGVTVNGGTLRGYAGGTVSGATISGGFFYLMDGNSNPDRPTILGNDIDVRGGSMFIRGSNALATNIRISAGDGNHYIQNHGRISGLTMYGGRLVMNINTGASPVDGTPYATYLHDATMSGGVIDAGNYAKVYSLTVRGGTFHVSNGATLSGATVSGAAGVINVWAGGKAYNVTVDGTTEAGRLDVYGYVSGARVSGTTPSSNYARLFSNAVMEDVVADHGGIYAVSGGLIRNLTQINDAAVIMRGNAPYVSGATVRSGKLHFQNGAKGENVVLDGGDLSVINNGYGWNLSTGVHGSGAKVSGADIIKGNVDLAAGGLLYDARISGGTVGLTNTNGFGTTTISGAVVTGGKLNLWANTLGQAIEVGENGAARVAGTMEVKTSAWNVQVDNGGTLKAVEGDTLTNLNVATGATVDYANGEHTSGAMIRGDKTNIAAGTLVYSGAVLDAQVADGVMTNLGANGNYYRMRVGTGITVVGAVVGNGHRLYAHEDAEVVGATINAGGNIGILGSAVGSKVRTYANYNIFESGSAKDTTVEKGGVLRFNAATAKATGTVVSSGGTIRFQNNVGGGIDDTTLKAGAALELYAGAETGDNLYLDFEGSTAAININNLALVNAETAIHMINIAAGNTYTFATAGDTTRTVNCEWSDYSNALKAGESYTNAFTGIGYSFNAAGTAITTTAFDIGAAKATAGSVTTDDAALNTNDRAAKWDANTTYTDSVTVAGSGLAGDAWLEIDGTDVSTALYGAEGAFGHTVNIYAKSGKIRNLAAGAKAGGSVAGVMLTVEGENTEFTGVAYAGGFGSVTGKADTYVADGTFDKDFYAGALANKNASQTTVGEVALSITGGTFKGNVYGASAVKTDTTVGNDLRNATGDVTVSVSGGSTDKADFCLFAGGYATGNATGTVYTVGDIDVDITGGTWVGETVHGGRGVFGGVMASGVRAEAQDVSITISGDAKLGNVFGGGWAQKGGTSVVDDVEINIEGGTVANVFGGGTHSVTAPGGSTVVDDVKITVSGGNITGAIYVGGQGVNDDVNGDELSVTFTGDTDFGCGVYGYSFSGGTVGDATLSFTGYSGDFSGAIGGFAGITFAKDTEMELTTAADDVSNTAWEFDFTGRADTLAGTSFLTWSGADFAGDTVSVNFTDATQAASEWSIATATFDATTTFDLYIGGEKIAEGIAYNTAVGGETAWADWKFTDDNGTLKFKQLA